MLSISAMSEGQAGYYLDLAREDYYLDGGEPPGQWFGRGAEALGLTGQVGADELYNLFAGRSPRGDKLLFQKQNHEGIAEHLPGWDLTFSAPKSVSTLWSQAEPSKRLAIQDIHAKAVLAALGYLQESAALTRRGKGGEVLERVGLIVGVFEHSTSRALDPQLHSHALVMNLSVRGDGSTGTLSSLHILLSKMAAGALYRAELGRGLEQELGISVQRDRSWFSLPGVSKDLIRAFSQRREAILSALKMSGMSSAQAASAAAIQTREPKGEISRQVLFQKWRQTGERFGWSTAQSEAVFKASRPRRDEPREIQASCSKAAERLTLDEPFFSARDFIRYTAEEAQGRGVGAAAILKGTEAYLANSTELIRLGEYRGEERYTTQAMARLELELLDGGESLKANELHQVSADTIVATLYQYGSGLSEDQLKAVWHVTIGSGALTVVSDLAGSEKTRVLDVATKAWKSEGLHVEGGAISARVASDLAASSHIPTKSVAKIFADLDRGAKQLGPKNVLIIDEAGLVPTPEMRKLILGCKETGAKLVLLAEGKQLPTIGPGAPFSELSDRFGQPELESGHDKELWAADAVREMAEGNARRALRAFATRGFLTVSPTPADAMKELIGRWRSDGERPENTLVLAGSKKDAKALNSQIQDSRLLSGELQGTPAFVGGGRLFVNDRVMFTRSRRTLGLEIGSKGTVSNISGDGDRVTVRLDSGEKVTLDQEMFPYIQVGYASTSCKATELTTRVAYVLGGGSTQAQELSILQATQEKFDAHFFLARSESGESVAKIIPQKPDPEPNDKKFTLARDPNEKAAQITDREELSH